VAQTAEFVEAPKASPFVTIRWIRRDGWVVSAIEGDVLALTGFPAEAFLTGAVDYASLIHENDSPGCFERVGLAAAGEVRDLTLTYRLHMQSGRERRILDQTEILRDASGLAAGFVSHLVALDGIAGPQQAEEFIAHASHEIRTPLTGIVGLTDALLAMALDPAQREIAEALRESSADLMQLVNNMLDLAKIDAGAMELDVADFRLGALCQSAEKLFARRAAAKGVALLTRGQAMDIALRGDPGRVRQVIYNLVGNAVKFTERGHVVIEWACAPPDPEGRVGVSVSVSDTGPGIAPDHLDRIFDSYRQADARVAARYGGTGLGLSIARSLAAMMGGRLWAESTPGEGSVFRFAAVFDASAESQPDIAALEREEAVTAARARIAALAPRVLVAEDAVAIQRVLELLLQPLGAAVVIARDGIEAVEHYRAGEFDIVLMDSRLPRMGGIEATQEIRTYEAATGRGRTPILALTAETMPRTVEALLRAGADAFLAKPFDPQRLIRTIAGLLPAAPDSRPLTAS
jgi:signal transduction histidine kinase/CheY-like chemotaxis protein